MMRSLVYIKIKLKDGTYARLILHKKDLTSLERCCQEKGAFLLKAVEKTLWTSFLYGSSYQSSFLPYERILTYAHLAIALKSRFSLKEALNFCGVSPKTQVLLWILERALTQGEPLESIAGRYPDFFIDPGPSIIRAGMVSGTLGSSFETLSAFHSQQRDLKEKIKKSLQYPMLVLIIMITVFTLLSLYVMPMVDSFTHKSSGTHSSFSGFYSLASIFISLILTLGGLWFFSKGPHMFAKKAQRALGRVPFIGSLLMCHGWWIQLHIFHLLVHNHYHPLKALEHLQKGASESYITQDIATVFQRIHEGKSFAQALDSLKSLPTPARSLLTLGAQTGAFHEPLRGACKILQDMIDHYSHRLSIWLEPLSLLLMGALMIVMVLSIFGPLYNHLTAFGA
jgi:type II secretory pathway component PulF